MPLTSKSVNLAGQPSQFGGTLTRIVGWLVLVGGLLVGLLLMGIIQAIAPEASVGFEAFGGVGIVTLVTSWLLLRGGKRLHTGGLDEEKAARVQAIFAMAAMRGGVVRAADVASALQMGIETADALLTDLAKTHSDYVSLELDDQGGIYYRIDSSGRVRARIDAIPYAHVRVAEPAAAVDDALESDLESPKGRQRAR